MQTQELKPLPADSEIVSGYSRFNGQLLFQQGGEKFWGTWIPPDILFSPNDVYHTVTSADVGRLDLIAYKYYQTPELWWVLAHVNGLMFSCDELTEGDVLRIPDISPLMRNGAIR